MALIAIRSKKTGKTDLVAQSAYEAYLKPTGLYEVIGEEKKPEPKAKPIVEEKIEPIAEKPKKQQPAITPIKPLKTKSGDDSKINSEI